MDSDDISVKDRCKWQLQAFEEQKADIVGGNIEEFTTDIEHPKAKRQVPRTDRQIKAFAKRRNPVQSPNGYVPEVLSRSSGRLFRMQIFRRLLPVGKDAPSGHDRL